MVESLFSSLQILADSKHLDATDASAMNRDYLKSLGCTHEAFFAPQLSQEDRCSMALTNCSDQFNFINFF